MSATLLYVFGILTSALAFDPDAGLVTSLTKLPEVTVTASSSLSNSASQANDGNTSTHWTSSGCLPGFYLDNDRSNILKGTCASGNSQFCYTTNLDAVSNISSSTDGKANTLTQLKQISTKSGKAVFSIKLKRPQSVPYVTIRGRYASETSLKLYNQKQLLETFTLVAADNYATKDFKTKGEVVSEIHIEFETELLLWEIAALGQDGCVDTITWDLGKVKDIGTVRTRHWPGQMGKVSHLSVSTDGIHFVQVAQLDPKAVGVISIILDQGTSARYIQIEHQYSYDPWAKVYVWELDAYDADGPYGKVPPPQVNPTSLREMLGVNGIWGWGTGAYSRVPQRGGASPSDPAAQGPGRYSPLATHGRNYHNMDWDVTDPDVSADYSKMASGKGTQSKWWLNWDTEYAAWARANLSIHASIQFTKDTFPEQVWDSVAASSRRYGEEFARHFGPTHGSVKIAAAEVGNEPWKYSAFFYKQVLDNMAAGLKAGDPELLVMPGAFQADSKEDVGNYIGTRVTPDVFPFIDVINFHHYSYVTRDDGVMVATYPEHPSSSFNSLRNMIRWRDANTPGKPIWVTEWGWDSSGAGESCNFPKCVSEKAAASYARRGLLLHARYGIQRSTWFFYGNLDCDHHVYCRSGLVGSKTSNFAEKKPFSALKNLISILGDFQFLDVVMETKEAYVYAFGYFQVGSNKPTVTHLVAWRPIDVDVASSSSSTQIQFVYNSKPVAVFCDNDGSIVSLKQSVHYNVTNSVWTVEITPDPIIVRLESLGVNDIVG